MSVPALTRLLGGFFRKMRFALACELSLYLLYTPADADL